MVGDAARQVNPLSGGGITSGMIGASIAGRIAGEAIKMNNPDHLLTYDKAWHDRLGKRHEIYNHIKKVFLIFRMKNLIALHAPSIKFPLKRELSEKFLELRY